MKFDLEKAKAGEAVEWVIVGGYAPVDFIGMHGSWVIVYSARLGYIAVDAEELRMTPKKVTVRYRLCVLKDIRDSGRLYIHSTNDRDGDFDWELLGNFVSWLTDWQTAEVTE